MAIEIQENLKIDITTNSVTDKTLIAQNVSGTWAVKEQHPLLSGTPVLNDFARFTDADTIEGRSYAEVKTDLSLNNVDNTTDANKPVSTATQTALDLKADKLNVLELDNTAAFVPNADYEPATKKYVDDVIASDIAITDAGGLITATDVEGALAENRILINALDAAVVLKGSWDASVGTFPGAGIAQTGFSYIVSVAGTVDGIVFSINDRIVALTDNASTTIYASNWLKLDYTDQVLSVNTQTGAVVLDLDDIENGTTYGRLTNPQIVDLTDAGDSALHYHATDRARANHTGTQLASTISDFDTQVATTAFIANGVSGGQTAIGDTLTGGNLTLMSTAHATKGKILFGTSAYDEVNNRLGLGTDTPLKTLSIKPSVDTPQLFLEQNNAAQGFNLWCTSDSGDLVFQSRQASADTDRFRMTQLGVFSSYRSAGADGDALILGLSSASAFNHSIKTQHSPTPAASYLKIAVSDGTTASNVDVATFRGDGVMLLGTATMNGTDSALNMTSGGFVVNGAMPSFAAGGSKGYFDNNAGEMRFYMRGADTVNTASMAFRLAKSDDTSGIDAMFLMADTGQIKSQASYDQTSGAAANMYVHTDGRIHRSDSSKRYKTDIDYNGIDWKKALNLKPVSFKSKTGGGNLSLLGFIAEDVHEVEPRLVAYNTKGQPDALHYGQITALNNAAIQALNKRIEILEQSA